MATVAQIRMLVNDPAGANQIFDDSHYEAIIELEPNTYRAAAVAARTLAAYFAQKTKVTAGPVTIEAQQKFDHYMSLAVDYDQRAREGGGSSGTLSENAGTVLTGVSIEEIDVVNSDSDRYGSVFSRGMDDNPTEEGA